MEAISRPFAAAESPSARPCHIPTRRAALADRFAPRPSVPLRFLLFAFGAYVAALAWLMLKPDLLSTYHYNQWIIAATHLLVLGWLGSACMGATCQLAPVALEATLHSEKLARWHFALHAIGVAGMVAMFSIWNLEQVGHFGSLLALGAGFFVFNMAKTLRKAPRRDPVALGVASGLFWLSVTILAGLYVACAKCWPRINPFDPVATMHAHAHLGALGYFLTMIVAVSYRIVPLFTLSALQSPRRASASLWLLNGGTAAVGATILTRSQLKPAAALLVIAGLVLYWRELSAILKARKRSSLDWGTRQFLVGVALLAPTAAAGLHLSRPGLTPNAFNTQMENAYGTIFFLGAASCSVLGMLQKIIPFLTWYAAYGRLVGERPTPSLAALHAPVLHAACLVLHVAGLAVLCLGANRRHRSLGRRPRRSHGLRKGPGTPRRCVPTVPPCLPCQAARCVVKLAA
jgi:hypothetical protein